jgi:hypothetical protein
LTKNELAYNFTFHEKLLILLPLSFLLANLQKSSYTLPSIEAVFPNTQIQLCIIHVIRNALAYVSYKDLKAVVADLKLIYQAVTETEAQFALELFADKWLARYSMAVDDCLPFPFFQPSIFRLFTIMRVSFTLAVFPTIKLTFGYSYP